LVARIVSILNIGNTLKLLNSEFFFNETVDLIETFSSCSDTILEPWPGSNGSLDFQSDNNPERKLGGFSIVNVTNRTGFPSDFT
jgi:hypothetical protein